MVLGFGCSKTETVQEFKKFKKNEDFTRKAKLKGEKLALDTSFPLKAYRIEIIDSLIIINENYNPDYCIYIFNKNNFKLLAKTGRRGKGPGEISSPSRGSISSEEKMYWLFDISKNGFWKFNLNEALLDPDYLPTDFVKIEKRNDQFYDMEWMHGENKFILNGIDNNLLTVYSNNGNVANSIGKNFIKNSDNQHPFLYAQKNALHFSIHPKTGNIAIAYRLFDRISIIDPKDNTKYITTGKKTLNKKLENINNTHLNFRHIKIGYFNPIWIKNFIVVPFVGQTSHSNTYEPTFADKLRVFKEDGTPVIEYELDAQISNFCYDKENKRIIALNMNDENPFVIYHLPIIQ